MRKLIVTLLLAAVAVLGGRAVTNPSHGHAKRLTGTVTRAVDGDTLHVDVNGRDETVRLIGIDTPESHKPGTPVECGARPAGRVMARLATGRRVTLVTDPTQDRRDRYGRLLAYVVVRGGEDLGEAMLRRGWAKVYVFDKPFARLGRYRRAAAAARTAGLGVAGRCDGDFHSAS